ncbi:syndecan-1 [Anolis sagrei]|uniref:syndecan-1 n=1 Tax=Anolis sagrei TaxID=38937 RepID=UPI003520E6F0
MVFWRARILGAVVLCFQAAAVLAQLADTSLPPEDQDSSGDDDYAFSGSGAVPSEYPVVAWNVPLQESSNVSLVPPVSTGLGDHQPEVDRTDSPTEEYTTAPVSTISMAVFPVIDRVPDKPEEAVEDGGLHSTSEHVTEKTTVTTTSIPVSHHISTARISTTQTPSTVKISEPEVYHDVRHIPFPDINIPASDTEPPSERSLYTTSLPTTSSTVQKDISSPPEEIVRSDDGSGDVGDFVFPQLDENPVLEEEPALTNRGIDIPKDEKSEAAAQGILDRKEVLGGVIAGGLVGLLFAGFLVGFMLYRMKKKDEGSYSLDEPKQSNGGYQKPQKQEEFYA